MIKFCDLPANKKLVLLKSLPWSKQVGLRVDVPGRLESIEPGFDVPIRSMSVYTFEVYRDPDGILVWRDVTDYSEDGGTNEQRSHG